MNKNIITGKEYLEGNAIKLDTVQNAMAYKSNLWGTFLQFKSINRRIKKGESGIHLVKYGKTQKINEQGKVQESVFKNGFVVFNWEQTEPNRSEA